LEDTAARALFILYLLHTITDYLVNASAHHNSAPFPPAGVAGNEPSIAPSD
jgi:hypothetical protein